MHSIRLILSLSGYSIFKFISIESYVSFGVCTLSVWIFWNHAFNNPFDILSNHSNRVQATSKTHIYGENSVHPIVEAFSFDVSISNIANSSIYSWSVNHSNLYCPNTHQAAGGMKIEWIFSWKFDQISNGAFLVIPNSNQWLFRK